jgi:hypothetical protein
MSSLNRKIFFSICSRKNKRPKSLDTLVSYIEQDKDMHYSISYDPKSVYEGHSSNLNNFVGQDNDIIVLCHDDIEIISHVEQFKKYISISVLPNTGFVGVAGSTRFDKEIGGAWWAARNSRETRGFVFQGEDLETATPNYFGPAGQVVALDGCFLAIQYKKLRDIGISKPEGLSSDWDFYDIHLTIKSHFLGYNNYAVPIMIKHESPGIMREGWYRSRDEYLNTQYFHKILPIKLNYDRTNGIPRYV